MYSCISLSRCLLTIKQPPPCCPFHVKNSSNKGFIGTIPKGKYSSTHHFSGPIVDGSEISNKPPFGCIPKPGKKMGFQLTNLNYSIGEFSGFLKNQQAILFFWGGVFSICVCDFFRLGIFMIQLI